MTGPLLAGLLVGAAVVAGYALYVRFRVETLAAGATLKRAADFAFGSGYPLLLPMQRRRELDAFLDLASQERPAVVVEIGAAFGGTLFLLCRAAREDALVVSIDLPGGGFVGPFGRGGYGSWRVPLLRAFAGPRQRLHLLRADSHDVETLREVQRRLKGRPVDLLFIDGDHSYEGVKRDFETYSPLVRPGGLVAFHDVNPGPEQFGGGVSRWWSEVRKNGESLEFIEEGAGPCFGIGVLRQAG